MFHQPPVLHRLFFALLPPPALARRIAAAAGWFGEGPGAIAAERLHLTLFILDDMVRVPPATVVPLRELARSLGVGPVEVTLDVATGSGRSVALRPAHRNAALARLHARIAEDAAACGIAERPGYSFAPHMTLGYRAGEPFSERVAPVGWMADELVLIDSHVGRTRHEVLGRWPLVDPQLSLF
jgi:2'-5' RNA ligase